MSRDGDVGHIASNIFLSGFMGSGKSTVGPALARRLGFEFVDLDREIEWNTRKKVVELFAEQGEAAFRNIEFQTLSHICEKAGQVVALGGGATLKPEARTLLARTGTLIYLRSDPDTLARRLERNRAKRPLLAGANTLEELRVRIESLLKDREAIYQHATYTVDSNTDSADEIARDIEGVLRCQK